MTSNILFQTQDNDGVIQVKQSGDLRTLHFNSEPTQSAISLKNPNQLQLDYAKAMMSWLLFKDIEEDDLLLMGLGGGSLTKYILDYLPGCRVEAIEYRAEVAKIAHRYFELPHDPRLNIVIDDGARYVLERLSLQREFYDIIMLDAFDATGMAESLCNPNFFAACQILLKKNGVLVVNLWNTTEQFKQLFSWIGNLFDAKLLFLPVHGMVNVIGLFFHEDTPIYSQRELRKRATHLEKKLQLPFRQFLKDLIAFNPNFVDKVLTK